MGSCANPHFGHSNYPIDLIPGARLIDIHELDELINSLKRSHEEYPASPIWQPDMIPFLEYCEVDYYCVRTLPDDQSVVFCSKGDRWTTICQNIEDFILIITECYHQKAYFMDDTDIERNGDLEEEIIVKFNPNYYSQNDLEPDA